MKRPSPALVISCVALFASLGGTGYAATHIASDAKSTGKHKAPKYVTGVEVNKLIAGYLKAHKIGTTGPQGPAGAPGKDGGEGKVGPQGPGAHLINVSFLGSGSEEVSFGAWKLSVVCSGSATEYLLSGSGTMAYTTTFGTTNKSGASITNGNLSFASEDFQSGTGSDRQSYLHAILVSGSTAEQLTLESSAEAGLLEACNVWGSAIPLS